MQLGVTIASGLIAIAQIARMYRTLRGTTLFAILLWTVVGIAAVTATEIAIAFGALGAAQSEIVRFLAAAVIFCPNVAILGAKRPQDRAWQLIVLSFAVILALPAAQAWLMRPGQPMTVHPIWSWSLVVLVVVGMSNYLPTRFALAAVVAATGQTVLVWRELPWGDVSTAHGAIDWLPTIALALFATATVIANISPAGRSLAKRQPLELLWRDFCDQFGVVWGLRVAERVNSTAAQNHWDMRLRWDCLTRADGSPLESTSTTEMERLQQALLPLLRRFVSADWIERRLPHQPEA